MLPIKEQISRDLLDALRGVQIAAGFNNNLDAKRVDQLADVPSDSRCILYEGEETPEEDPSLGHDGFFQTYIVRAWALESEFGASDVDTRLALLGKDIARGVMLDPHRSRLAHNTRVLNVKHTSQAEPPAVDVTVEIHYRTLHGRPYEQ